MTAPVTPPFVRYIALLLELSSPPATPPPSRRAPRPRQSYTAELREEFTRLRESGMSIGKTARQLGVPFGTAKWWDGRRRATLSGDKSDVR